MTSLRHSFEQIKGHISALSKEQKNVILYVGLAIFCLFFSYPFMRSTVTSLFIESFGAVKSPYVWLCSIVCLSAGVSAYNRFFYRFKAYQLFFLTGLLSLALFIVGIIGLTFHSDFWLYFLYIVKETYIILLVHSAFAFINITLEQETAKVIYGPLGTIGSIGGLLGGLTVASFDGSLAEVTIMLIGSVIIALSTFAFFQLRTLDHSFETQKSDSVKPSPLASLGDVRTYVFCIALIVVLSQFVISIANYEFNFFIEKTYPLVEQRTSFLGQVYGYTNALSLMIQFLIMPFLFKMVSPLYVHFAIPVIVGSVFLTLGQWGAMGLSFIVIKGLDYSLFSGAKELLYFSLSDLQKYGAKYLVDMIAYRLSKGVISLVLILIPTSGIVIWLFTASLLLWFVTLCVLKKLYDKLQKQYQ